MFKVKSYAKANDLPSEVLNQSPEKGSDMRRDQRRKPEAYMKYVEDLRRGRTK